MKTFIVSCALLVTFAGCSSNQSAKDPAVAVEPREYKTGSNLPRRGPSDVKEADKEALQNAMRNSPGTSAGKGGG
jgi:hypothetical protein